VTQRRGIIRLEIDVSHRRPSCNVTLTLEQTRNDHSAELPKKIAQFDQLERGAPANPAAFPAKLDRQIFGGFWM
jgi:hypothetical protein